MQAQATILWGFLDTLTKFIYTLSIWIGSLLRTLIFAINIFRNWWFIESASRSPPGPWSIDRVDHEMGACCAILESLLQCWRHFGRIFYHVGRFFEYFGGSFRVKKQTGAPKVPQEVPPRKYTHPFGDLLEVLSGRKRSSWKRSRFLFYVGSHWAWHGRD